MNQELGSLLKSAFLSRRTGSISKAPSELSLVPGERRNVAVLFLDLLGFTAFSETLDHETVHLITKSLMDELVITAEQYSGYVDKIEGDRIMVLFGAIRSNENNSRSAILCGFKMLNVIEVASTVLSEADVNLSARIGINSGPVTVAPDAIGHLTAMGNTVNIASRMEEKAGENSILATDTVYERCSENILWEESRTINIRGIGVPIISWKPLAVNYLSNIISCHETIKTVFVGRELEYAQLQKAQKQQLDLSLGRNRLGGAKHIIIELTGDAGTGKTRLVSEFLKNTYLTEKSLVLRGNSIPDAQPAHWLWSALLKNLLKVQNPNKISYNDISSALSELCSAEKLKGAFPFLGRLVSTISSDSRLSELGNKAIASETKMALRDLLESLSENYPLTVVLEDLQWMDSTDADILDFIVKNCFSNFPIIFLLIRRSDQKNLLPSNICDNSDYSVCKKIILNELKLKETSEFTEKFIRNLNGNKFFPVSTDVIEFVQKHSSGNPFFLQELLLHLLESGGLALVNKTWSITDKSVEFSTPGSLTGLIQSRLDRLPEKNRIVLRNCSVFGMEFRLDIYRRLEDKINIPKSDIGIFNSLVELQFLNKTVSNQDSVFSFRHSFVQNTAYSSILSQNLKVLHKAVAQAMEEIFTLDSDRVAAKIADHWEKAGEEFSAIKWGNVAQKHASRNYQYKEILKWGEKLDRWLSPHLDKKETQLQLLAILEKVSSTLIFLRKWNEVQTTLDRMLDISTTNNLSKWISKTELQFGNYYTAIRNFDKANKHFKQSLNLSIEYGFIECERESLSGLGVNAGMCRDFKKSGDYFKKARDLQYDIENLHGKAKILGNLGILYRRMGESHKAIPMLEEVLTIFQEIGDVRPEAMTLGNLGSIYEDLGNSDKAKDLYPKAISIFHRLGDRVPEAIFLCNLGSLFRRKNLFSDAEEKYSQAKDIIVETGDKRTKAWILTNLGLLYIRKDIASESEELFNEALQIFTKIGDKENQAIAISGLGYVHFLTGNIELALDEYVKAYTLISELKLSHTDFTETFILLHKKIIESSEIDNNTIIQWPEHWKSPEEL